MSAQLALLGGKKVRTKPFPPHPVLGKEEERQVRDVLKSGMMSGFIAKAGDFFLGGVKVKQLEADFKKYFKVKHAVAVNSATAGLHCAIAAVGVGPGDEVIVTPYTMSATAAAIVMCNAVPVFADIEADTFCLDPVSVEKKITPLTRAIVVVHLMGQAADMDRIMEVARRHKLAVIEDTAQSPGAKTNGRYAGTIGDAGIFSLNQHKTITTGEGGVVVTNDDKVALKMQLIRNHGETIVADMQVEDIVNTVGWNYRMTELEAAVGIAQFRKLDRLTKHRVGLADHLTRELKKRSFPGITLPHIRRGNTHVYFVYPFKFDETRAGIKRETFLKAINAEGIPFGGYSKPLYLQPMYQRQLAFGSQGCPFKCPLYVGTADYSKGICPTAERMFEKDVMVTALCRYPLTKKDIGDVVKAFDKVFAHIPALQEWERSSGQTAKFHISPTASVMPQARRRRVKATV